MRLIASVRDSCVPPAIPIAEREISIGKVSLAALQEGNDQLKRGATEGGDVWR